MASVSIVISAIDATGAAIGTVQGKLTGLQAATTTTGTAMDRAGGQTVGFIDKIARIAAGVVIAVGVMNAMTLTTDNLVGATLDYDASLGRIIGLTGTSKYETQQLSDRMLELGQSLPISPVDLASAGYFILSSGIEGAADAALVLETSARAAAAGLGETSDIADVITSALNAYGLEAGESGRLTDVLVAAVREGKAEADEFGPALAKVTPIAALLGVSFEEVAANLATATRAGYDVDLAATGLRQTLLNLVAPSKETQVAMADLGISADEVRRSIKDRGLLVTLEDLMERSGGNVEVLDKLIPNVRGLAETLATVGSQGAAYNDILVDMYDSQGSLDTAFQAASETLEFRLGVAMNSLRLDMMNIGANVLPPVISGIEFLSGNVEILVLALGVGIPLILAFRTELTLLATAAAGPIGATIAIVSLGLGLGALIEKNSDAIDQLPILGALVGGTAAYVKELAEEMAVLKTRLDEGSLSAEEFRRGGIEALTEALDAARQKFEDTWDVILAQGEYVKGAMEPLNTLVDQMLAFGMDYEEVMAALSAAAIDWSVVSSDRFAIVKDAYWATQKSIKEADLAEHFDMVRNAAKTLGDEVPISLESLVARSQASWDRFKQDIDDSKTTIEDILPTVKETFDEWVARLEQMVTDYGSFQGNLEAIYGQMQGANLENAEAILATIAEKGPEYTAMFTQLFATDPQKALALLGQLGPGTMDANLEVILQHVLGYAPTAYENGAAISRSIISGMDYVLQTEIGPLLVQAGVTIDTILATMRSHAGAESPSRMTAILGEDMISGLIEGMIRNQARLEGVAADTIAIVAEAMEQPAITAGEETAGEIAERFVATLWTSQPQLADAMSVLMSAARKRGLLGANETGVDSAYALVTSLATNIARGGDIEVALAIATAWDKWYRASTGAAGTTGIDSAVALTGGIADKVDIEAQPTIDAVERSMAIAMTKITNSAGLWGQSIGGYLQSGIYQSFLDNWEDYAGDIAAIIVQGLEDALGAHSPASAMIPLGVSAAQGYALGFAKVANTIPLPVDVGNVHNLSLPGGSGQPPTVIVQLTHQGTLMGNEIEADAFARMIGERVQRNWRGVHV